MTAGPGSHFGKAADDYGTFRAGFPDSLYERLARFGVGLPGQQVVDLGTGTGTLARGFARRDCRVTGVDMDPRMLAEARALSEREGVQVRYVEAGAESTGLPAGSADVVSAGQCWHWFDRAAAAAEVLRLLKRPGQLVIAHFDWLPLPGNVVEATERLIESHNPLWRLGGGMGVYGQWLPGLTAAGFHDLESFSYDVDVAYAPDAWRGRIRASAGIAALDHPEAARFDDALARLLAAHFPGNPLQIPHRVFAIVARAPALPVAGHPG